MDEWIRFGGAAESNEEKDSRLVKALEIYNGWKRKAAADERRVRMIEHSKGRRNRVCRIR